MKPKLISPKMTKLEIINTCTANLTIIGDERDKLRKILDKVKAMAIHEHHDWVWEGECFICQLQKVANVL